MNARETIASLRKRLARSEAAVDQARADVRDMSALLETPQGICGAIDLLPEDDQRAVLSWLLRRYAEPVDSN